MNALRQGFGTLIRSRPLALSSISTAALSSSPTVSILPHSPKIKSQVSGCRPKTLLTFFNSQQKTIGRRFLACDASANPEVKERFDKLVKNNKVVVFMKGVPDEPRCGFSNAVVQILRMHGVTNYDSHDVLSDETIRQGIKDYTNWPTIPQVFIDGEFVGGCDILIEMHKNGELVEQLSKVGIKSALLKDDGGNSK